MRHRSGGQIGRTPLRFRCVLDFDRIQERVDELGWTPYTVGEIAREKYRLEFRLTRLRKRGGRPSIEVLYALSQILKLPMDEILKPCA